MDVVGRMSFVSTKEGDAMSVAMMDDVERLAMAISVVVISDFATHVTSNVSEPGVVAFVILVSVVVTVAVLPNKVSDGTPKNGDTGARAASTRSSISSRFISSCC